MPNLQHKLLSTTYSEIWLTGLEKTPLGRCQPQLAPYKRRIYDINVTLNSVFTLDCKNFDSLKALAMNDKTQLLYGYSFP